MGKDGFLTPKAIANRIKAKGLQKLKWYCQVCEKQCRDENGFKCHMTSESHLRQILLVGEAPEKYLDNYSKEFKNEFVKLLSRRYNTKRVLANQVYQEFISDRHHLHMNATHWDTLTDFVKHLGREGICTVDETPKGWYITWIDNSPKALERQAAIQKRERQDMDDEQREQRLIQEQIERARLESGSAGQSAEDVSPEASELVRQTEDEKIKLNLSLKSIAAQAPVVAAVTVKPKPLAALAMAKTLTKPSLAGMAKPLSAKPLSAGVTAPQEKKKLTAMEEIMMKDLERKRRKEEQNGIDKLNGGINEPRHLGSMGVSGRNWRNEMRERDERQKRTRSRSPEREKRTRSRSPGREKRTRSRSPESDRYGDRGGRYDRERAGSKRVRSDDIRR